MRALLLVLLLAAPAAADPGLFVKQVPDLDTFRFDRDAYELLLEDAVGQAPEGTHTVRLVAAGPDGILRDLESYLPDFGPPPVKEQHEAFAGPAADAPGLSTGALSGRAVYLSQCHGFKYYESLGRFSTQRGNLFDTVEDFHNPEGANAFLTAYLENAGAGVYTVRERDMNPAMVIIDNGDSGYSESGSGFVNGPAGFADASPWLNGEDPFNEGTTRRFPADGGAVATWIPAVPEDGLYAVYVSWDSDPQGAPDAHYRLTHPGGVIDRHFDQTRHGSTWQYVETLWLPGGTSGLTVELIGDSTPNTFVTADAVRVGGGVGDVHRVGDLSGANRWEESANLYIQWNGAPTSIYDPGNSGNGSDVGVRSRWAAWEHPSSEDAVYLSWHSNAGGGTGTVTLIYDGDSGTATPGSSDFATILQDEIVSSIRARWDSGWSDRGVYGGGFGELNPVNNSEMPAALVELGFHDHAGDTALLKEPRFRQDAARAMMRGVVRYFAERDGVTPTYLPEPPTHLVVRNVSGALVASWSSPPSGAPLGDPATGYRVYTSDDGRSWDNGTDVSGTSHTLSAGPGELVFVRVAATNAGGISFPTETLGARRADGGAIPVLIVDSYDRLQASQLPWHDAGGSIGLVRRMTLARMNAFDSTVPHATAVDALGWPFDSASDEAVLDLVLGDWDAVLWAAGEESTTDETFSTDQRTQVEDYVNAGGALFVSGSEVLWDMDAQGTADDLAFAIDILGAEMGADDSGTTAVDGVGLLAGLSLDFDLADAWYDVDFPDVLDTSRTVIAQYVGGGVAAALGDGVAMFGFPFETIVDEGVRDEVMARVLGDLVPGFVPGGDDDDATADDDDVTADDDDVTADDDDVTSDDDDVTSDDDDVVDDDDVSDDDDVTTDDDDAVPGLVQAERHSVLADSSGDGCSDGCESDCSMGGGTTGLLVLLPLIGMRRRR